MLYSFSNNYVQLPELLSCNQLSELIASQIPKLSLVHAGYHSVNNIDIGDNETTIDIERRKNR